MKKVLLIWLLAAGFASAGATAQNIALGERVPELKIQTWLDNRQPQPAPLLRPYLSERISVGLNAEKSFTAFGVSYLPFGVLTDAKNRTLWMGNSLQINEKLIEQSTR